MSALAIAIMEDPAQTSVAAPWPDGAQRTTEILVGEAKLRGRIAAIQELRRHAGRQEDLTTDPYYFIAANAMRNRRITTVLIRRNDQLEACVYFFEHCRLGVGLGLCRGGDGVGDGLVAGGPSVFRIHYIQLATQALLQQRRVFAVSLAVMGSINQCLAVMGPADPWHRFAGRSIARELPLMSSYRAMLESLGARTRRSLAGKRRRVEHSMKLEFVPWIHPEQALEAMLSMRSKSQPRREPGFFEARSALLRDRPEFFCMGLRLPGGNWLSILSGWRHGATTYVDLQLNHEDYRRESLSAVMRSYLLEYEISFKRQRIHFVGGTSILLRRYCAPAEPSTYAFVWRPCLRAHLFRIMTPLLKKDSVYERFSSIPA